MPLRRLKPDDDGQLTPPSSTTTTTPISGDRNAFQLFTSSHVGDIMPPVRAPLTPPHLLGPPTDQAVSALAEAIQSGYSRRHFNSAQNEQIAYDEETSERSQVPQDKHYIRRTTSTPRNGSLNGDHMQHPPLRRNSHASSHVRGSVSNISELTSGPIVLFNPHDPYMLQQPPPMLSRAPSMSQMWYPQPPPPMPQFAPYYYGPNPFTASMSPPDPRTMRKAIKQARKLEKKRRLESDIAMNRISCGYYCCDGIAQLLWAIIIITLLGFVIALILALFVL